MRLKIFKLIILAGLVCYFGIGAALAIFQKEFTYFPDKQDFNDCPDFAVSRKLDLNGTRAYYQYNSPVLVVFYHGNAGSACGRAAIKDEIEKNGASYLFVEYAGYANGKDRFSKDAILKNVRDAANFIAAKNFQKVVVIGESLGTAPAVYHSTLAKVDRLVLVSPFCKMAEVAQSKYPAYPVSCFLSEDYDNCGLINQSRAEEFLVVHGKRDAVIPFEQAEKLFRQISSAEKNFVVIDVAGHNDIYGYENARQAIFGLGR